MDTAKLAAGWAELKMGSLWHANGRCKGFADANPGEAAKLDAYVAALVAGLSPAPPVLATFTGIGLVMLIQAGIAPPVPPPVIKVAIGGTPVVGQKLTAVAVSG